MRLLINRAINVIVKKASRFREAFLLNILKVNKEPIIDSLIL